MIKTGAPSPAAAEANKLAYSLKELSQQTSLSVDALRKAVREKRLKARYARGRILIFHTDFMDFIDRKGEGENTDEK